MALPQAPGEGFFWGNDPNVNQQLRQRIAMAMLSQKKGYPKTLGEGLASIGDAIGDIGMMRMLQAGDAAQQAQAKGVLSGSAAPAAADESAPVTKSSYAPADDAVETPAVKAIDTATDSRISPEDVNVDPNLGADEMAKGRREASSPLSPVMTPPPLTTTPPGAQPQAMFSPRQMNPPGMAVAPAGGNAAGFKEPNLSEVPRAAPGPQSAYRPAPPYLQARLAALIPDPERRGYLGQLAGKEAQSPNEVSPTGATGPFQFTRGTARDMGLVDRTNIDQSIIAANKLTDYNAKILERGLGRPPTPGELALAHQQGAGTAVKMLTGAGNASAGNLAVNAVSPTAGPQAAAQKIMKYYGMPGGGPAAPPPPQAAASPPGPQSDAGTAAPMAFAGLPPEQPAGDARDAIAQALMRGSSAQAVPQPNPTSTPPITAADQVTSPPESAANPPIPFAIPGAQMAQAQTPLQPMQPQRPPGTPQPDFGYVMPAQPPRPMPQPTKQSDAEQAAQKAIIDYPNNPYVKMKADQIIQDEQQKRAKQDAILQEQYRAQTEQDRQLELMRQQQIATQAQRRQEGAKGAQGLVTPPAQIVQPGAPYDARLGTPQSPQRSGVPAAPPVPGGVSPSEHAAQYAPILTQAVQAEQKATPEFNRSIALVQALKNHPGREWGLGTTGKIAGQIPGTEAFAFHQMLDQLQGKEFLQAYQTLKGGGSITEIEGAKATQALARLNASQNKNEFDNALSDLEKTMRGDQELAQRKINKPVTAWRSANDNSSVAPDIGERRGSMEYIGGNPADKMSWRKIQ